MSHRMRPFRQLLSKGEALERLLSHVEPTRRTEEVPLSEAAGRVVAEDVASPLDVPAFSRSAMDGYAVRAEDTFGAYRTTPKRLRVTAVLHAGDVTDRPVEAGEAIQIATGCKLPPGADAVVKVESTDREGDDVLVAEAVPPGANVSRRGSDVGAGAIVLRAGNVLTPARIGLAASLGCTRLPVFARPRVAVVPTGNEIAEPGNPLPEGHVYNSNAYALEALFRAHGAEVARLPVTEDTVEAHDRVMSEETREHDILFFSGGSSVGERDILVDVIRKNGEVLVHGVQVKPGKPLLVGKLRDGRIAIGLPGYPTSCVTNAYAFGVPALRRMARLPPAVEHRLRVPLGEKIVSNLGRYQILPVALRGGKAYSAFKESGALTSLTESDGFIGIPDNTDLLEAGDEVEVTLW